MEAICPQNLPQRRQRWIELSPSLISNRVSCQPFWIRLDALGYGDAGSTGSIQIGPRAGPNTCHKGCAEGSPFFGGKNLDGMAINPGLNLPPERTARTSAT